MNKKLEPILTFILFIGISMMLASMPSICSADNFDRLEINADSLESILVNFIIDGDGIKIKKKNGKKPVIPFGKKIILSGSYKSQIDEIEIRQIYDDRDQTLDVNVSGNNWYALTGPFSPDQEVVLIFFIKSVVTDKEKEQLLKNFTSDFEKFRTDLFETTEIAPEDVDGSIKLILQKNLSPKFKNYRDSAGNTLKEKIIETLMYNNMSLLEGLVSSQELVRSKKMNSANQEESIGKIDQVSDFIEQSEKTIFKLEDFEADTTFLKSYFQGTNQLSGDSLKTLLINNRSFLDQNRNILQAEIDSIENKNKNLLEEVKEETIHKIKSTEIISAVSLKSGFGVKDIERYAGFDLGPTFINSESSVTTMFTANIYFERNEVNKDLFPLKDINSKNLGVSLKERVSLTAGIGITTPNIDKDSPLFFIGAGFRVNRIFRITYGYSFHRPAQEDPSDFIFSESIGISVNFRYISDLLQIFNSTTSTL